MKIGSCVALVALAFVSASPTQAFEAHREWFEAACAPRDAMIEHLKEKYGERVIRRGFIDETQLMEMFATPGDVTWSLVIVRADGSACVLASGKNLENVAPKLLKPTGQPI